MNAAPSRLSRRSTLARLAAIALVLPLARARAQAPAFDHSHAAWSALMKKHVVLIDGGPLFTGLSASALPLAIDAAVLVRHASRTPERAVLRARDVLDAGGIPLLGLAETFS